MKQTVLMVLLMAAPAAPALGEPGMSAPVPSSPSKESAMASQDPLMRQILHRQLTQRNGGITAAVRIASGQSIELQLPDVDSKPTEEFKDALNAVPSGDPLAGLKPEAGLVAAQAQPVPADASQARKPTAQLKVIDESRKDWGDAAKSELVKMDPEAETEPAD
ncbi:MAG: hypothetical protein NTY77_02375 [Elusimicrobia bacterium]|nr:hypothetical protein [Elusimicrobiota bacterium]